jgi:hypothetical protein
MLAATISGRTSQVDLRKLPLATSRKRCIAEVHPAPLQTFNLNVCF